MDLEMLAHLDSAAWEKAVPAELVSEVSDMMTCLEIELFGVSLDDPESDESDAVLDVDSDDTDEGEESGGGPAVMPMSCMCARISTSPTHHKHHHQGP